MSEFQEEEREAIIKFMIEFYKEAVTSMEADLGRQLTREEFEGLRDSVLKKFFKEEE